MHVSQTTRCACILILFVCFIRTYSVHAQRSILRLQQGPYIETQWENEDAHQKHWQLHASCLTHWGVFGTYNQKYLNQYELPNTNITYRNNDKKSIPGKTIKKIILKLIQEVQEAPRKTTFSDVIVLKDRDFNFRDHSGDIIVRCKDYPFVIKLFIETPQSFVKPCKKGLEPASFFFMSSGSNRFLAGLSRIKNLEMIKEVLKENPKWSQKIDVPRKWYWEPPQAKKFVVSGYNMGPKKVYKKTFPAVYAIIGDYVPYDDNIYTNPETNPDVPEILNLFGEYLDPNPKNYVLEKGTGKIVIIDTEHFPTLMGTHDHPLWKKFKNYRDCYAAYAGKFLTERYGRNKCERKIRQYSINSSLY